MSAFRAALVAVGAAVLTAACAAGQQAQTSEEVPTLDGTQGSVGSIVLAGVALHTPGTPSYAVGATVPMSLYIANNGQSSDALTNVTSTAFTGGWGVVSSSTVSSASAPSPSASAASASGSAQTVAPGAALSLGLQDLKPDGSGSDETLVLKGLTEKLFPGSAVKITFTFANAGQTTLMVPVQLSAQPNSQTLAPPSGEPSE